MGTILLDVTHSSYPEMRWAELRFDSCMTVAALKQRLERHVGSSAESMTLYLVADLAGGDDERFPLREEDDAGDATTLGAALAPLTAAGRYCRLHIEDCDPNSTLKSLRAAEAASDVSQRYRMSEDKYAQRDDSARHFLKKLQAQKPELFSKDTAGTDTPELSPAEAATKFPLGARCEVQPGGRRGEIRFVGSLDAGRVKRGLRVGVRLDEPLGDSDGRHPAVPGRQLVDCAGDRYCCFAAPEDVTVGDFPPVDPFDLDEI